MMPRGFKGMAVPAASFIAAGLVISAALWRLASAVKPRLLGDVYSGMFQWVHPYFHPYEGALLNYLFLAAGLAVAGLVAYFLSPAAPSSAEFSQPQASGGIRRYAVVAAVALLLVLWIEPLRLIIGPVPLMNEYPEIFSTTILDGKEVNNGALLASGVRDEASLRVFRETNQLEYLHQVMGRGQINHIGHVLNPVNEYSLGKPLRDIYLQYGLGNTLLFKLTMEVFGGVSIQNYYKCYLYYILYYGIFLAVLFYLFRDALYVLCAFLALAFTHFAYNYIGFVLAPGIIPTIHFFDAAVAFALAVYLKRSGPMWPLAVSALLVSCGILFNRQFGGMLAIAWSATLAVYGFENKNRFRALIFLVFPLLIIAGSLLASGSGGTGDAGIFKAYFSGYFSWAPARWVVLFTAVYLTVSYLFLIRIKGNRSLEKYLYIFSFVYTQGLLVYFYWSGLPNHLPVIYPFITLQVLFAAVIVEKGEFTGFTMTPNMVERMKLLACAAAIFCAGYSARSFYFSAFGASQFRENFRTHKTYEWRFDRARLVSTIPPAALEEAVAVIRRYSSGPGITLISKYDNLLPFLSGRYSLLPHFEMPWYLIGRAKFDESVRRINELSPEYLFVDSDMDPPANDPWAGIYPDKFILSEQVVRTGRIAKVRALFQEMRVNYRLVEPGRLISVYRKVPGK